MDDNNVLKFIESYKGKTTLYYRGGVFRRVLYIERLVRNGVASLVLNDDKDTVKCHLDHFHGELENKKLTQQEDKRVTVELSDCDTNDKEENEKDNLANLMTKYYQSLTKKLAATNGKLADAIVRMEVIEESITELQKYIDSDIAEDRNSNDEEQNVETTRQRNESITLPIATLDKFNEFEQKISQDNSYRRKIILRLLRMVDDNIGITRNIGCIMRAYFERAVALQFTSVKKIGEKIVFIQTNFFHCLSEVLTKKFSSSQSCPLSEDKIKKSLQSVINNVKDWDGQRCIRMNKSTDKNAENAE